jgi:hypothetical protein
LSVLVSSINILLNHNADNMTHEEGSAPLSLAPVQDVGHEIHETIEADKADVDHEQTGPQSQEHGHKIHETVEEDKANVSDEQAQPSSPIGNTTAGVSQLPTDPHVETGPGDIGGPNNAQADGCVPQTLVVSGNAYKKTYDVLR